MKTEALCTDVACDYSIAERPRYYARQLMTDEIMRLEQRYFLDRMRRHNRLMHGWGVACGAQVCISSTCKTNGAGSNPWEVVVKPGYILGPYGDEIVIDCERVVDLRTRGVSGVAGEPCVEPVDPWCSDVYVPREPAGPLYVAVKYKECLTRPVRVQPIGCGCDDTQCEYSRLRDGYEIGILTCCPEPKDDPASKRTLQTPLGSIQLKSRPNGLLDDCPACPTEPWVVLAQVMVDADGVITKIDNCECRRIVISLGSVALGCETELPQVAIEPDSIKPHDAPQETRLSLTINGKNFRTGMCVDLGPGIKVNNKDAKVESDGKQITVDIEVAKSAQPGKRTLTLANPGCATFAVADAFEVTRGAQMSAGETAPGTQAVNIPAAAGEPKRTPRKKRTNT
jgi:hypothetical protein